MTRAVRSFYSNLSEVKSDSQEIKNASKLAKRCYKKLEKGDFEDGVTLKKVSDYRCWPKIMSSGNKGGFLSMIFDVRTSLIAQLPKFLFLLTAKSFTKIGCNNIRIPLKKENFNFKAMG